MNEVEKKEFKRIKKQSQEAWLDDDDIKFLVDSIDKLQKENEDLHREINQRIKLKIEKIKNFSKEEQKALEYFELLRNVIVERDSEELDEGIDLVVGRKFASKIDLLLNLVITLEEDKEDLQKEITRR